ncbi:MAG: DUF4340 domain-containing protein [Clostridia bacterium]|nr:DUF4340 domain-containing protein [Clostridia bacterium]
MNNSPLNDENLIESNEEKVSEAEVNAPIEDGYEDFGTIFGDPQEKKASTGKGNGKKRLVSIIASVLAVAILVGGTVAIVKLIPEKEPDDVASSAMDDIKVLTTESDEFNKVTVTNSKGKFVFNAKKVKAEEDSSQTDTSSEDEPQYQTVWSVEGVDSSKTDSNSISVVMSGLESITASKEITQKTAEECGLTKPTYKVDVESKEYGNFSVLFGKDSPDGTGTYLKLSTKENIYLVDSSAATAFDFHLLDFAENSAFEAMEITDDMKDYTTEGALTSFDKLTVSGENFEDTVVIEPNSDEAMAQFTPFIVTSPTNQIADKVEGVLDIFAKGLTAEGAYSFEVTPAELKKVGLDKPDIVLEIKVAGNKRTYKFSRVDEEYCAVVTDGSKIIKKVAVSNVPFIDYNTQSFYSAWVFLRSINDLSNLTFETEGKKYSFDIVYDDAEDAEETYIIKIDGKKLNAENFQNFYQHFISVNAADFNIEKTTQAPDMKITATYAKTGAKEVLTFTRTTATKYQYNLDGKDIGRITSAYYNKIVKYLKMAAADEIIEE